MTSHSDSAEQGSSIDPDVLDRKANEAFGGKVVRKDLVRKVKVGANVPVFVLEYLLGKYCASDGRTTSGPTRQTVPSRWFGKRVAIASSTRSA